VILGSVGSKATLRAINKFQQIGLSWFKGRSFWVIFLGKLHWFHFISCDPNIQIHKKNCQSLRKKSNIHICTCKTALKKHVFPRLFRPTTFVLCVAKLDEDEVIALVFADLRLLVS
jgi:hypothetical protein